MSIQIKVSYTEEEEFAGIARLLAPVVKSWKKSANREGRYKKAYGKGKDVMVELSKT